MKTTEINSYSIGTRGEQIDVLADLIQKVLQHQKKWRSSFFPDDPVLAPASTMPLEKLHASLDEMLRLSDKNNPYFHPRYMAQMLKDPGIAAIVGYLSFMLTNPNNHAYEGGPVTTDMEMDVVSMLLSMCGFEEGWGHLCSGGSLANQEALWAARDYYQNNGTVYFSKVSHYSWKRICKILAIPSYFEIPVDEQFHIDLNVLEDQLKQKPALMVVANIGSTGSGSVDNLEGLLTLRQKYGFHLHADAAYGGFFRTMLLDAEGAVVPFQPEKGLSDYVYRQLKSIESIDSITIDPHKQGLISYGAGAVLYKNEALREVILNTAPYTYHLTEKPNIGMFTLEGSRPGAMAAACWLTYKTLPLTQDGVGSVLQQSITASRNFYSLLLSEAKLNNAHVPDLDINCFFALPKVMSMQEFNRVNTALYKEFSLENEKPTFILSKFLAEASEMQHILPGLHNPNNDAGVLLRSVFMKHWYTQADGYYLVELIKSLNASLE